MAKALPVRSWTFSWCALEGATFADHAACLVTYPAWDLEQLRRGIPPPHWQDVCDCPCHPEQAQAALF